MVMGNSKISGGFLVHAVLLLGILLVQSCEERSWGAFQNMHVDHPKTTAPNPNAYCNLMMRQRNLIQRPCKSGNTFINCRAERIRQLCQRTSDGYETSPQPYPVVKCTHQSNTQYPNCQYTGMPENERITVLCERNLPVHLGALVADRSISRGFPHF
uniref:Ribonuclease A-domain domain-containing protein n=1 Tax=Varanus komodoensis TaxID=61221 RepID=A0A8D2IQ14_VARKO